MKQSVLLRAIRDETQKSRRDVGAEWLAIARGHSSASQLLLSYALFDISLTRTALIEHFIMTALCKQYVQFHHLMSPKHLEQHNQLLAQRVEQCNSPTQCVAVFFFTINLVIIFHSLVKDQKRVLKFSSLGSVVQEPILRNALFEEHISYCIWVSVVSSKDVVPLCSFFKGFGFVHFAKDHFECFC